MNAPQSSETPKAIIYCRVSTVEQVEEGNSLATQERLCREYALKNDFSVPEDGVFIERGESAKTAHRTELGKMIAYCAQKKRGISALIVYKIDRLSRNTDDYSQLRLTFKRYGVSIRSTTEQIEDTPVGRFMENTMANIAQLDNDIRAERCSNGMREAVREGRYVWAAPVGYVNVRVAEKATIAQSEMASLVHRTFEVVSSGLHPTDEVWRMMTREGLAKKNGKPLSRGYFYDMLRNRLYTGLIEKFGEKHRGHFEPIVSDTLFEQVQRVLANKGHKVAEYKTDNPAFPLRRFVLSPQGLKLTGSFSKGKYPYYRFGPKGTNYERDDFERQFAAHMDSFGFEASDIAKLKRKVREKFQVATADDKKEVSRLEGLLRELGDEETTLVKKNIKGVLGDAVLTQQLKRIEKETTDAQARLALLRSAEASPEEAVEYAEEYLRTPSKVWKESGISTQTRLQWFQFPSGLTFNGEKFGTPEICTIFKAKDEILSPLLSTVDPRRLELLTPSLQMRCSTN